MSVIGRQIGKNNFWSQKNVTQCIQLVLRDPQILFQLEIN
jgi:hypothetical protein